MSRMGRDEPVAVAVRHPETRRSSGLLRADFGQCNPVGRLARLQRGTIDLPQHPPADVNGPR